MLSTFSLFYFLLGRLIKGELLKNDKPNTPKSESNKKSKANTKTPRKPLWSEVVKRNALKKTPSQPKDKKTQTATKKIKRPSKYNTHVQEVCVVHVKYTLISNQGMYNS